MAMMSIHLRAKVAPSKLFALRVVRSAHSIPGSTSSTRCNRRLREPDREPASCAESGNQFEDQIGNQNGDQQLDQCPCRNTVTLILLSPLRSSSLLLLLDQRSAQLDPYPSMGFGRSVGGVGMGPGVVRWGLVWVVGVVVLWGAGVGEASSNTGFQKLSHKDAVITTLAASPSAGKSSGAIVFNIKTLGAKGDGTADDTQWFVQAWAKACASTGTVTVLVPKGYSFVLQDQTFFVGKKCTSSIIFQVDGMILGPSNYKGKSSTSSWIQFTDCKNFTLQGKGTLNARGDAFWKNGGGPTGIRFLRATNVAVLGVTIANSPQVHLKFNYANGVLIQGITIDSPELSPNTDGIHLQTNVYNVQILDCVIGSGDDCISIGTMTFNVIIQNIICGPGHGISIGSLGTNGLLACVSDIDVSNVTFVNTLCGARIKTCSGGKGKAARISYRDIKVQNVKFPILIDQYYCGKTVKPNNVILDQIQFMNIQGTTVYSKTGPVQLSCASPGCTNVRMQNINITPTPSNMAVAATCSNAYGTYGGEMQPPGCLQNKVSSSSRSYPGCAL